MRTDTYAADDLGMGRLGDEDDVAVPVTEHTVLPAGTYPVEFLRFERMETQFGEALKMQYRVTSGPHADALVDELCSLKGGRGSKLKERLGTLRGQPYKPGEVLRPKELFGRTAQAYLTVKKVMGDDGEFEVNRIGDLQPWHGPQAPGAGTAARRPVQAGPQEEPPDEAWGSPPPPPDDAEEGRAR